MFTSAMFASILPEILVLILGILILVVEPFWKEEKNTSPGLRGFIATCTKSLAPNNWSSLMLVQPSSVRLLIP